MNKKVLIVLLVLTILISAGCIGSTPKVPDKSVNPDVTQNIKSDYKSGNYKDGDWCKKGSEYTAKAAGETVTSKVLGITTYQGREVCESEYTTNDYTVVYYVSEDNTFYYQIMKDKEGKVISESGGKES